VEDGSEFSSLLLAAFREKAEPLGVVVKRVGTAKDAAREIVLWGGELGVEVAVISSEIVEVFSVLVKALAESPLSVAKPSTPEAMRDLPLGVSLARMAIAETGSMLLAEPSLADRCVGMLTLAHVIVCPTDRLVGTLEDAAPELRRIALAPGGSFATFITGPSRTADIERVLTVGVQGPGKILNIFVDAIKRAEPNR
jgi:L-lactate dehydrogenase complex protein LldG